MPGERGHDAVGRVSAIRDEGLAKRCHPSDLGKAVATLQRVRRTHGAQATVRLRVLDAATLFAGPLAATMMADFGAEVIKIEHPKGDPVRYHGHRKDDVPLWWKMIGRNKRTVSSRALLSQRDLISIGMSMRYIQPIHRRIRMHGMPSRLLLSRKLDRFRRQRLFDRSLLSSGYMRRYRLPMSTRVL